MSRNRFCECNNFYALRARKQFNYYETQTQRPALGSILHPVTILNSEVALQPFIDFPECCAWSHCALNIWNNSHCICCLPEWRGRDYAFFPIYWCCATVFNIWGELRLHSVNLSWQSCNSSIRIFINVHYVSEGLLWPDVHWTCYPEVLRSFWGHSRPSLIHWKLGGDANCVL